MDHLFLGATYINVENWKRVLSVTNPTLREDYGDEMNAAGLEKWQATGGREKLHVYRGYVTNDIHGVVHDGYAGHAL